MGVNTPVSRSTVYIADPRCGRSTKSVLRASTSIQDRRPCARAHSASACLVGSSGASSAASRTPFFWDRLEREHSESVLRHKLLESRYHGSASSSRPTAIRAPRAPGGWSPPTPTARLAPARDERGAIAFGVVEQLIGGVRLGSTVVGTWQPTRKAPWLNPRAPPQPVLRVSRGSVPTRSGRSALEATRTRTRAAAAPAADAPLPLPPPRSARCQPPAPPG